MNKLLRLLRHFMHHFMMFIIPEKFQAKMLSCQEVSHLVAQKPDVSSFKKFKLHMHLFICQKCLDYKKQMDFIDLNAHQLKLKKLDPEQQKRALSLKVSLINQYSKK